MSHTLWYLLMILTNSNYTLNAKKKKKKSRDLYKLPKSIYHSLFIPSSVLCYIHALEIDLLGYVGERGRWRQRAEEKVDEEILISVT